MLMKMRERQQWAGAYICDNTVDFVNATFPDILNSLKRYAYLIEYKIPFKTYIDKKTQEKHRFISKHNLSINWANMTPEQTKLLNTSIRTGYPFLSTILDSFVDEVQNDSKINEFDKENLVVNLDRTQIDREILDKWDNTKVFYEYAKDKGRSPLKFGKKVMSE